MREPDSRLLIVATILVVLLLVAGSAAVVVRGGGDDPAVQHERQAGGGEVAPPDELAAVVEEVRDFVADARELEWLRDVEVELADDDTFRQRLLDDAEADREELEEDASVLRALKLLADDVDLYEVLLEFLGDSVIGFYDPETDELVLRGTALTPYVRSTLAHELVHALDDQHFELHRPELDDAVDESGLAFSAVVEGNAVRIESAYRDSLTEAERGQLREEEAALAATIDLTGVPPVVPFLLAFPYVHGPGFIAAVHAEGGERAVDDALRSPPTTSEHILDPATWIGDEEIIEVQEPRAGGEPFDEGAYGQYALELTLAGELGVDAAREAARGWGGDAYVAWSEDGGSRTCVRARFAMDTAADLEELEVALRDWTAAHGDAELETGRGVVGFTACG